jgi:hypothetical protein
LFLSVKMWKLKSCLQSRQSHRSYGVNNV